MYSQRLGLFFDVVINPGVGLGIFPELTCVSSPVSLSFVLCFWFSF
jgi:hypothetical protein